MPVVFVNIGSNLGNRRKIILQAIEKIADIFGFYTLSDFVESAPWGFDSRNRFLNVGMAFKSDLHPEKILLILQKIEKSLSEVAHRDSSGNYKDREIDIDIMSIDNIRYQSPTLCLPHPYLYERPFFLEPLRQLSNGITKIH